MSKNIFQLSMGNTFYAKNHGSTLRYRICYISETISDVEIFFINPAFARKTNQNLFFVKLPVIQIQKHNGGLENDNGYIHSFHLLFCDCDK